MTAQKEEKPQTNQGDSRETMKLKTDARKIEPDDQAELLRLAKLMVSGRVKR